MTKAQHTPGPWTVEGQSLAYDIVAGGHDVFALATVQDGDNARLIAAAPELLERLVLSTKALLLLCDSYEKENMGVTQESIKKMRDAMAVNNAIIAKATGE